MTGLTIYKDTDVDSTVLSNLFIDEYMGEANDAQLKVYLYLLRMMNAHKAVSVASIADKFNHTEKEVLRALKYWEKKKLLALDFDEDKNLEGIHIHELLGQGRSDTSVSVTGETVIYPEKASASVTFSIPSSQVRQPSVTKPAYSADQLREFRSRESSALLIHIAESYIGKPLSPAEINYMLFFSDELHFSDDLIDYLLQYCVDIGKKDFKYIQKVAISWAEKGISTPEEAQKNASLYDKKYYAIMRSLGKNSSPAPKEAEYISRWLNEYSFEMDVIIEACERTVLSTDRNRFEYAERILKDWFDHHVHHKADIAAADAAFRQQKAARRSTSSKKTANSFAEFEQRDYDFEAIEEKLLSISGKRGD